MHVYQEIGHGSYQFFVAWGWKIAHYDFWHILLFKWPQSPNLKVKDVDPWWKSVKKTLEPSFKTTVMPLILPLSLHNMPFYPTDYDNINSLWPSEYYLSLNYFPRSAYYYNLYSTYPNIKLTGSKPCNKPPHLSKVMVDLEIPPAWLETETLESNSMQTCCFSTEMLRGK